MADHDFEALRAERNRVVRESMKSFADEKQIPLEALSTNYSSDACYCACAAGGPCEHRWDGEGVEFHNGWSATCSRCGGTAMGHGMRVGP